MQRFLLLLLFICSLIVVACGDDDDLGITEDNLAGTWLLLSSDGTAVTNSNIAGGMSTINSEFTLLSSDLQITFERNPNVVTGQSGSFTLETTQSMDGSTATTTTEVSNEFSQENAAWTINGDVLTFTFSTGETESHVIEELSNTTLRLRQDVSSEINLGGGVIATESSTITAFERQ